ncbi:MAG: hypothetical protein EHM45_23205 [Desulfobacteraceae bacterium]|nr:MAG: hypothetical protein EHM45_23205 [Desulfobacteraceae bacterium]
MPKKAIFILSLALGVFLIPPVFSSAQDIIKSEWAVAPLNIDGLNTDWAEAVFSPQSKVKADFAFRNDGQNIYLIMIFKDPKFLSSIDATGMKIFFNTEGKKKKDRGLRFFKKMVKPDEFIASLESKGQMISEEEKTKLRTQRALTVFDYELLVKEKPQTSSAPQTGAEGIDLPKYRFKRTETGTVYEFRIPLTVDDAHPAGLGVEPGKTVKIGFEWGGLTDEMRAARLRQASGDNSGIAGESIDHYVVGSWGGSGPPPVYNFWIDIQLAVKTTS